MGQMRSATASATPGTAATASIGVSMEKRNGTVVVRVTGDVDVASSQMLDDALTELARQPAGRVMVDLSDVTFMDSSGLRALVQARDRMDRGRRWLVVCGATGQPRRLLDIGRVHYGIKLMPEA